MIELLVIVPHPDDEVFSTGGILSKMADANRLTGVVTLTKGGKGRTLGLCEQAELPALRTKELQACLETLGVNERHLLDFPDGGLKDMVEDVVPVVTELVEKLQPTVVVTFGPNGSNGHFDHVATHQIVNKSLEQSKHEVERVYYFANDKPFQSKARDGFLPPEEVAALHFFPTHYFHVGEYMENKLCAMAQHDSQSRSVTGFLRGLPRRMFIESFHRAKPAYPEHAGSRTVQWL